MKHKIYIALITLIAGISVSCSDWLDVQPKTEVKQDLMFESESGFKDALIGCYIMMGSPNLYGLELTYTFMEVLAQQYLFNEVGHPYQMTKMYAYTNGPVESRIEGIWAEMYRVVANLNAILENLEVQKGILHPTNYANIKAEALGLRAYLHFDLLRMFGWGELAQKPENLDRLCIPYVTRYHKDMTKQSTVKEVLEYIHKDLDEAEKLLAYYDVYNQVTQDETYELPNSDGFYENRRGRFNYYAARATQARVYLWEGNYEKALERAAFFTDEQAPVEWVNLAGSVIMPEDKLKDLTFSTEHIFNLDINKMYDNLKAYIEPFSIADGSYITENRSYFYVDYSAPYMIYEAMQGCWNDQRRSAWFKLDDSYNNMIIKFREYPESKSPAKNKMPLIRKPEMFYIAAECYNHLGKGAEAVRMLNEVRQSRGIESSSNLEESLSTEEIADEIRKEWQKEYFGEGQIFYFYKRLGMDIPNASVSGDAAFVLPLPKQEVDLGGREDYKDNKKNN